MNDYEYEIQGAPVVYTNRAPEPNNPLNRPKISFWKPIIIFAIFLCINVICVFFFQNVLKEEMSLTTIIITIVVIDMVFLLLVLKRAVIWLVHLYQHYAPDEVRLKCVFEPSCSEYMIMAIEKYGALRGVGKGIGRLLRCHPPNGGKDVP